MFIDIEKQFADLISICNYHFFTIDKENFAEIYSIWLFHKKRPNAISIKQAQCIDRIWRRHFA